MEPCALNDFFSPAQRARYLNAVGKRHSVRTFKAEPDVAQISALQFAAARVCLPGVRIVIADGAPELLFRNLPLVGGITGTAKFAAVIADPAVPHAALHAGISGEAFQLEAVSLGVGCCWVISFRKKEALIPLKDGEQIMALTPLGVANEVQTMRKRKALRDICADDPSAWPLWAYHAAECVRQAPSAINRQPWLLSYAGRTLVLGERKRAYSPLDMGIALLHMSLGAEETPNTLYWGEGREVAVLIAEENA